MTFGFLICFGFFVEVSFSIMEVVFHGDEDESLLVGCDAADRIPFGQTSHRISNNCGGR